MATDYQQACFPLANWGTPLAGCVKCYCGGQPAAGHAGGKLLLGDANSFFVLSTGDYVKYMMGDEEKDIMPETDWKKKRT